jgi:alkanesulfonate monooxygenase SsuD/methylene tetrahydromethanopterin reductase-like flavin-dependent oxidoreductase (luciferase family)
MHLGYFMMPMHPPGSDPAQTLEQDLQQVERLDQLGYEEVWVGEHFTAEWENIPAPDLFIAAALQRTQRIVFGTGVSCMPNHNPMVLAHRIAQLDQMARGRFIWGIGAGSFVGDMEMVEIDPRSGYQREVERDAVDLVLKLWQAYADGAAAVGRTVDRSIWRVCRNIHVAETAEQARREALEGALGRDFREYFLRTARKGGRLRMFKQDPSIPDDAVTPEYLLEHLWIVGDPEGCARQIRELYDAAGGFGWLVAMAHDWPDPRVWDRSMRLLIEEVMPRLADVGAAVAGD